MTTIPRPTVRAALTDRGFIVHYLQMLLAMGAGMLVLGSLSMLAGGGVMLAGHVLMLPAMALAILRGREEYVHG